MQPTKFERITILVNFAIQNLEQNNAINENNFTKFDIDLQNAKTNINN